MKNKPMKPNHQTKLFTLSKEIMKIKTYRRDVFVDMSHYFETKIDNLYKQRKHSDELKLDKDDVEFSSEDLETFRKKILLYKKSNIRVLDLLDEIEVFQE
jgi:hypothetical protein